MVIGWPPKRAELETAAVMRALSPNTRLRPSPAFTVSPSVASASTVRVICVGLVQTSLRTSSPSSPAIRMSSPLPEVRLSLPPMSGSVETMRSMSLRSPSATT